jgi:hypothetical protein
MIMRVDFAKLSAIILTAAISGCATAGPPPVAPAPPAAAPVTFDGTYRGTIQLTSSAVSGAESNWCNTPPALSLSIQNGTFKYILSHPNVPQDPNYSMSPTFNVAISPGGSFDATSVNGEAEMTGGITGAHMEGRINGSGCGYKFTADKS